MEFKFKDGKKEVKVGDEVFVKNVDNFDTFATITKIDRYLIHLDTGFSFYFDGSEKLDYDHNSLYSCKSAYDKVKDKDNAITKILRLGTNRFRSKLDSLSDEDFKIVTNILNGEEND